MEVIIRQLNTKTDYFDKSFNIQEKNSNYQKLIEFYENAEKEVIGLELEIDKIYTPKSLSHISSKLNSFLDSLTSSITNRKLIIYELQSFTNNAKKTDSFQLLKSDFEVTKITAFDYQVSIDNLYQLQKELNPLLRLKNFSDTLKISADFKFKWILDRLEELDNELSLLVEYESASNKIKKSLIVERKKTEELNASKRKALDANRLAYQAKLKKRERIEKDLRDLRVLFPLKNWTSYAADLKL